MKLGSINKVLRRVGIVLVVETGALTRFRISRAKRFTLYGVETATGSSLDNLSSQVGLSRIVETDEDLRDRIRATIGLPPVVR